MANRQSRAVTPDARDGPPTGHTPIPSRLRELLGWAENLWELERVAIEGMGSFGAGLSRFLPAGAVEGLEVGRPKRHDQPRSGKSDLIDAELAARAVLSGVAIGETKGTQGGWR